MCKGTLVQFIYSVNANGLQQTKEKKKWPKDSQWTKMVQSNIPVSGVGRSPLAGFGVCVLFNLKCCDLCCNLSLLSLIFTLLTDPSAGFRISACALERTVSIFFFRKITWCWPRPPCKLLFLHLISISGCTLLHPPCSHLLMRLARCIANDSILWPESVGLHSKTSALLSARTTSVTRKRWTLAAGAGSRSSSTIPRPRLKRPDSCLNSPQSQDRLNLGLDAAAINPHQKKKRGSREILQETKRRDYDKQLETSAWSDSWFNEKWELLIIWQFDIWVQID